MCCREELNKLMEANGAASPGALVLVAGLSKPFRRLDKYDGILQELKRYMEESHVDRGDVSRSISVYKNIAVSIKCVLFSFTTWSIANNFTLGLPRRLRARVFVDGKN